MYFFLNSKIVNVNSGVEHAEARRLKLFKQHGAPAKILTYYFAFHTHDYLKSLGLSSEDLINFFDFFGGSQQVPTKKITVGNLPIPANYRLEKVGHNRYQFFEGEKLRLGVFPDPTYPELIGSLWTYSNQGRPLRKDYFDSRGYLACALHFDFTGHRTVQSYFSPDGKCYAETYYERDAANKETMVGMRLIAYRGANYFFDTWDAALTFFYDEVNKTYQEEGQLNTFISDRSNVTNFPMTQMTTPAIKIEQFHSKHYRNWQDIQSSMAGYPAVNNPELLKKLTGIIVPTTAQKNDLQKRLALPVLIYAIPVGFVAEKQLEQAPVTFSNRTPGSIIAVARPAYQKQLDQMILAVGAVQKEIPQLHLDIYGVPAGVEGDDELNKLQALVTKKGYEDVVTFHGYVQNLLPVYEQAQLCLFTSRWEGFGLGLLEAISYGVPTISYDFNYGAQEMITEGQNGFLVPQGDLLTLQKKIAQCFTEAGLLERLSAGAYEKVKAFSAENVWKKWQTALAELESQHKS